MHILLSASTMRIKGWNIFLDNQFGPRTGSGPRSIDRVFEADRARTRVSV